MTLKAPLKISAIGLSLLAIAVSSCNKGATNTSSDTNNNTPAPLDPKDDPASNKNKKLVIKIAQPKIPSGTCAKYELFLKDEAGTEVNLTNNKSVSVSIDPTSAKNFSLQEDQNLICAFENVKDISYPALEGGKAIVVATNSTSTSTIDVEAAAPIKLTGIKIEGDISGAVGTETQEFEIKTQQMLNGAFEALTSSEGFELVDANGNIIELKSKSASKFYFEIPKNTLVGKNAYTLRYTATQGTNIETTFAVDVTKAVLKSIALKNLNGETISNVLTAENALELNLEGIFSDGSTKDLTAKNSEYTITRAEASTVDFRVNPIILSPPTNAIGQFLPQVAGFEISKVSTKIDGDFNFKFYANNKPQLVSAEFERMVDNLAVKNATTVPVGGSLEEVENNLEKRCAKLTGAQFTLGNAASSTPIELNRFNQWLTVSVPQNSNFKVISKIPNANFPTAVNYYVCATEKAKLDDKVIVTIASREDASVKLEKEFSAGAAYQTNKFALVSDLGAKVADSKIVLSAATQSRKLIFAYLNSDNSVSDKEIKEVTLTLNPASSKFFTIDSRNSEVKILDADALKALAAGAMNSQKIIATSADNSFSFDIPVTFSK